MARLSDVLQTVYQQHRQGLFSLALSITLSRTLAEDAVHEAFVKLVRKDLPAGIDPVPYVYQSVRFAAIDAVRTRRREQKARDSLFNGYVRPAAVHCPCEQTLTAEGDALLRQAIDELSETEREAVILKTFAGLTFEQAGQAASVPPKTVATRYRRALQKLQNRLRDKL